MAGGQFGIGSQRLIRCCKPRGGSRRTAAKQQGLTSQAFHCSIRSCNRCSSWRINYSNCSNSGCSQQQQLQQLQQWIQVVPQQIQQLQQQLLPSSQCSAGPVFLFRHFLLGSSFSLPSRATSCKDRRVIGGGSERPALAEL